MKNFCWVFVLLVLGMFSLSAQGEAVISTEETSVVVQESSSAASNHSPSDKDNASNPCHRKVMPTCDTACFGVYDCCSRMNYSFFYLDENTCSIARSGSVFAPRSTSQPLGITLPIVKKPGLKEIMEEGNQEEPCPDCGIIPSLEESIQPRNF